MKKIILILIALLFLGCKTQKEIPFLFSQFDTITIVTNRIDTVLIFNEHTDTIYKEVVYYDTLTIETDKFIFKSFVDFNNQILKGKIIEKPFEFPVKMEVEKRVLKNNQIIQDFKREYYTSLGFLGFLLLVMIVLIFKK